jgi:putative hydrolase of the HAD superfamily
MKFTTLFFDLDDTLYTKTSGLWPAIRDRIGLYMVERMGVPADRASEERKLFYETYGTTLRGLQLHYQVDSEDFLAYVHDLPLERYIGPDPQLRRLLLSLPQEKWIFTNADDQHARRVLEVLGVSDLFTGVVDVVTLDYCCKPNVEAYQKAMHLAGEQRPERCVLFDDSPRNLQPARDLGLWTVLVGEEGGHPTARTWVKSLLDLPDALPDLWAPD